MYHTQSPCTCMCTESSIIDYNSFGVTQCDHCIYTLPLGDHNCYVSIVCTLVMYISYYQCACQAEGHYICMCVYQRNLLPCIHMQMCMQLMVIICSYSYFVITIVFGLFPPIRLQNSYIKLI